MYLLTSDVFMNYCQSQNTDNDPNDKLKILAWWTF